MYKQLVLATIFLGLMGCDKSESPAAQQKGASQMSAVVPKQNGQYLRFVQLESGETRLEAYQVNGARTNVISGHPGFAVKPGTFPLSTLLAVRIKDCGTITFTRGVASNQEQMVAVRTNKEGFSDKCPISNLSGLWTPLTVES